MGRRRHGRKDVLGDLTTGAKHALGLTPGPTAFPWQTHARGLTGHLVFGLAAHATLYAPDAVA